jgi:hypothetical protein
MPLGVHAVGDPMLAPSMANPHDERAENRAVGSDMLSRLPHPRFWHRWFLEFQCQANHRGLAHLGPSFTEWRPRTPEQLKSLNARLIDFWMLLLPDLR